MLIFSKSLLWGFIISLMLLCLFIFTSEKYEIHAFILKIYNLNEPPVIVQTTVTM